METIILVLLMGGMNLVAFYMGAKVSQQVQKGKDLKLPQINPIQIYQEKVEQREANKEQERLNTIMENINNYCGDSTGQKDIN